jgi:hypothetical protein
MGTKRTDSCLQKAGDDEPIFVLRAQDELAPDIVSEWANRALAHGSPIAKVQEARELARRMREWQAEHIVKVPD